MQNLLKSLFISVFPMFTLYVCVTSIWNLTTQEFSYGTLGSLLVALPIVVLFAGLFMKPRARTTRNLNTNTIVISLGTVIVLISQLYEFNLTESLMVVLLISAWGAYISWYSVFEKRDESSLKVGDVLAEFELEDDNKNKISSSTYLGNPTIFLFYRGNWCPLCMAQIKEIAGQYKALEQRGVNMVFVSPQPHKFSKQLADKYMLNFNFLTDTNNTVAKQLGIFTKYGIPAGFQVMGYDSDTVLPTVIITDAQGKIVFADLTDNYRVRPEPETFLKVIDSL